MSNNQFLQDYFIKYNLDYTKIKHKHKKILSTDSTIYSIESKGDTSGIVVTKNNVSVTGSLEQFPLFQLLHVKVNISSWNNNHSNHSNRSNYSNHLVKKEWSEEEIIKFIFKLLKNP